LTKEFAAYCAGFFDGEGCLSIKKVKQRQVRKNGNVKEYYSVSLCIDIAQNSLEVLETIQKEFGGTIHGNQSKNPNSAMGYILRMYKNSARVFLEAVQPYSVVKRNHVKLGLDYVALKDSEDESLYILSSKKRKQRSPLLLEKELEFVAKSKELNRRGLALISKGN